MFPQHTLSRNSFRKKSALKLSLGISKSSKTPSESPKVQNNMTVWGKENNKNKGENKEKSKGEDKVEKFR